MKDKFIQSFKEALEMEDEKISLDDEFRQYAKWDSLSRLSLIALLDEQFNVTIEDEVFKNLITVGDLYNEVSKRADTAA